MKRLLLLAVAAGALTLSACQTATPYQPLNAGHSQASGGFYDQRVEQNRWRVGFKGNSLTSRERVERYLLFRSAEITVQNGFDWFTTQDRNTERKDTVYSSPGLYGGYGGYGGGYGYGGFGGYWGPRWGLYRRGFGWGYGAWGDPFWGSPYVGGYDLQQVSRYDASAEILMGRGPKPAGDRRAFDAHQVIDNLRPTIELPK